MKTITVNIPIDDIVAAVGPEVVRILQAKKALESGKRASRPPILALREATQKVCHALTDYEANQFSRGERGSLDRLIAAARGLRTANGNLTNQI